MRDPKHVPDYVDKSRTHENSVIMEAPDVTTIRKEIAANRQEHGQQKLRADARTTVAGIITFGTKAQTVIDSMSKDEQDEMFLQIAKRVEHESGHKLLGLVVHRDETAIHAHYTLRGYAIDKDGKEQAWRKNPTDLKKLQDIAGEEVAELGIKRGKAKEQRIKDKDDIATITNRSVKQLHEDLPLEIAKKEEQIEKIKSISKNIATVLKPLVPEPSPFHRVEYIKKKGGFLKKQVTGTWKAVGYKDVEKERSAWKLYATEVRISAANEVLMREDAITKRENDMAQKEKQFTEYERGTMQLLTEHRLPPDPSQFVRCAQNEALSHRLDVLTGKTPAMSANDHGSRIDGNDIATAIDIATKRKWQGPVKIGGDDDTWKRKAAKAFIAAGFEIDAQAFPGKEADIKDIKTEMRREAYKEKKAERGHDKGMGL